MSRFQVWRDRLDGIRKAGLRRRLRTILPTGPVSGLLDGREVLIACSNDYLGLAWRLRSRGGGAGGSRLISGSRPSHETLERAIEEWLGQPALFFPSGYQANLAVFSTVCREGDTVASDALNHASIIDGLRLSKAERVIVPHADPDGVPDGVKLLAVEGLYSMEGDIPPLARYPRQPWLAVDEAHALGCLGPNGRGSAAAAGITPDILIGTFGKAFGTSGAFVAGPPELKELLVNAARPFIYTTAPSEAVAKAALQGLHTAIRSPELREKLARNAEELRENLSDLGWTVGGVAHILPVHCGERAMEVAERLLAHDVFAPGIRYPTVPAGLERIRVTVSAEHCSEDLARIADAFGAAG